MPIKILADDELADIGLVGLDANVGAATRNHPHGHCRALEQVGGNVNPEHVIIGKAGSFGHALNEVGPARCIQLHSGRVHRLGGIERALHVHVRPVSGENLGPPVLLEGNLARHGFAILGTHLAEAALHEDLGYQLRIVSHVPSFS